MTSLSPSLFNFKHCSRPLSTCCQDGVIVSHGFNIISVLTFLLSHMSNFTLDIPCGMSSSFPHGCSKCQNGTLGLYHSNPTSPSPQIFYSLSIPLSIEPEHLTQDSKALSVWHLSTFHFFLKPTSRCSVLGSLLQLVLLPGVTLLLTPKALAGLSDFSFRISCSKKSSLITPDLEQLNP